MLVGLPTVGMVADKSAPAFGCLSESHQQSSVAAIVDYMYAPQGH
jgi:hypothetical protein